MTTFWMQLYYICTRKYFLLPTSQHNCTIQPLKNYKPTSCRSYLLFLLLSYPLQFSLLCLPWTYDNHRAPLLLLMNDPFYYALALLRHPPIICVLPCTYKTLHSKVNRSAHIANFDCARWCIFPLHDMSINNIMSNDVVPKVPCAQQVCPRHPSAPFLAMVRLTSVIDVCSMDLHPMSVSHNCNP